MTAHICVYLLNFSVYSFKFMLKPCLLFCTSEATDAFSLSVEQRKKPKCSLHWYSCSLNAEFHEEQELTTEVFITSHRDTTFCLYAV